VLVFLGAAGAVGLAAIAIAKALGARVVAAASSEAKLKAYLDNGADVVVEYSQPNWHRVAQAATAKSGIDVVYDPVGRDYSEAALRCLSPGGRLLVVGLASGTIPRIRMNLPLLKQRSTVGVNFGGYYRALPEGGGADALASSRLVRAGSIRPYSHSVHSLADAPEVIQSILDRCI
jgi:NADPH2:quinone reductase